MTWFSLDYHSEAKRRAPFYFFMDAIRPAAFPRAMIYPHRGRSAPVRGGAGPNLQEKVAPKRGAVLNNLREKRDEESVESSIPASC